MSVTPSKIKKMEWEKSENYKWGSPNYSYKFVNCAISIQVRPYKPSPSENKFSLGDFGTDMPRQMLTRIRLFAWLFSESIRFW